VSSPAELEPADSEADDESAQLGDLPQEVELRLRQSTLHMGPIPDAELLAKYEDVLPGLAHRIVQMAEREQAHRHAIEQVEVHQPYQLARRGQILAITAIVLVLAFAVFLAAIGSPITAGVLVGIDLLGLVTVFITGQRATSAAESEATNAED